MSRIRTISVLLALAAASACGDQAGPVTAPSPDVRPRAVATGTPILVTNLDNDGPGSLRAAIAAAVGGETIQFDPGLAGGSIMIPAGGQFLITKDLTIEGPSSGGITIDADQNDRILFVGSNGTGNTVTLRNMTLTGGRSDGAGGAALVFGTLVLDHVLVTGNTATSSQIGQGSGNGGGIAVYVGGHLTLVNSTIAGNTAEVFGGGIFSGSETILTNSTIAGNTAATTGGIVSVLATGSLSQVRFRNTIVAGNSGAGSQCDIQTDVGVSYVGTSLFGDASCGTGAGTITGDPLLGPIASNGGPTRTMALLRGSPAVDAATDCNVTDDQRYVARPQPAGGACDIGAYEFDDYVEVAIAVDPTVAVNPNTGVAIVTGTLTCSAPGPIALDARLEQTQRNARTTVVARATGSIVVSCTGSKAWSISLAPPTGAFQNGSATAALSTSSTDPYVTPASSTTTVKMYWGHR